MLERTFCVAPMMDWTDRHCRYFLRLISKKSMLYTEMVTTGAVLYGNRERLLGYDQQEHPLALQLGGSQPQELAESAKIAEDYGYDEINLNVGCPSDRVQAGRFGACLMLEPDLVADCVAAMSSACQIPVTVKSRLGVDNHDSYEMLVNFIEKVSAAGCKTFILHARKAWLKGLSPKENREIPPLNYAVVHSIKKDFPTLEIIINGGIASLEQAKQQLCYVDGVMLGRAAYHNPFLLAEVDSQFYACNKPVLKRHEIMEMFYPYVETQLKTGVYLSSITRHILGLYQGLPGARYWRRHLTEQAIKPGAGIEVLKDAVKKLSSV